MSGPASRRLRGARNALAEALGLGETLPLRDLPLAAEPAIATFGSLARVGIADSERAVTYRLLDQDGRALPQGAAPEGAGSGEALVIETPPIAEDITFTVRATKANGRSALLLGGAQVKVGLDATLPVQVAPAGPAPTVIDFAASVEVEIASSQEGVTYRLVARPSPDPAAPEDLAAMAGDVPLSPAAGIRGTGGTIRLTSMALRDDSVIHVRATKTFAGAAPRPPQTTLLQGTLAVYVRPDANLEAAAQPAVIDHGATASIALASSAKGVSYTLHGRRIADAEFSRAVPPDPATLAVATGGGTIRIAVPPPVAMWQEPAGFAPLGQPVAGTGGTLALPVPALTADTVLVIEARKQHGTGAAGFTSAERLDRPAVVLVRPDPAPPLRLAAFIEDGKMVRIGVLSGEPGVFYALAAAAPLGELYLHQISPDASTLNKGVGALGVGIDMVVATGDPAGPTSQPPPPLPWLDVDPLALPASLAVTARRATTGLTADLGTVRAAALPSAEVRPAAVAAGAAAKVVIAQPVAGERYALVVDGRRIADPVAATGGALSLDTGPLAAGARLALWAAADDPGAAIRIERQTPLPVTVS
ncbi:MAG: hypothetical protein ABW203_04610 [Novosphingobium sp.]